MIDIKCTININIKIFLPLILNIEIIVIAKEIAIVTIKLLEQQDRL
jgi:hypothetical protein